MVTKTLDHHAATPVPHSVRAALDVSYSMAPITWTWYSPLLGGVINSPDQVIGLNQSYAFGFTITSNANVDAVCEVSAVVFGDSRRASKWTAQVLDPPVVMIPAHGSATVLVEVTTTDEGDTADPPRCELIVSAVEINPAPHVVPGQARLSIMALKEPPGPDSQSHIQLVMNAPGGSHSKLDSGIQVGQLPIDLQVFVDTPGDYNLTATLRDPTGWTIQNIYGSPFQISAGNTAGARVNLGPLTPGPGARQTDLFITVTGKPGTPSAGISATFPLPIMPWK